MFGKEAIRRHALRLPDFIGIGAGKSGTTWISETLRRHPQIFSPDIKELNYFNIESHDDPSIKNTRFRRPLSWYAAYFDGAGEEQLAGEFSPAYLPSRSAPGAVHACIPDVRLLAVLRNPLDRARSEYLYKIQRGTTDPHVTFFDALNSDATLVDRGRYGEALRRWLAHFDRKALHVIAYDDLVEDPRRVVCLLHDFLGIERRPETVGDRPVNATGRAAYPRLNRVITRTRMAARRYHLEPFVDAARALGVGHLANGIRKTVRPLRPIDRPDIERVRAELMATYFSDDVVTLSELTDRDFVSLWK